MDALVVRLRRHAWTSDRLDALALGGERAAITWTDGVLSGEDDGPSDALKLKCLATGSASSTRLTCVLPTTRCRNVRTPASLRTRFVL